MSRLIVLLVFLLFSIQTYALNNTPEEQILNFNSQILVNQNASLDITETIVVNANQHKIRHGLVRLLPMNYFDAHGVQHKTTYKIRRVLINNAPVPYQLEQQKNLLEVYIGARDLTLDSGRYTFLIQYQVKNAINFWNNADEIYWNVTGNYWDFPILKTRAEIQLPPGASISHYTAVTGKLGLNEQNYTVTRPELNKIIFTVNQPLTRKEGFFVNIGWPKGIVHTSFIGKMHASTHFAWIWQIVIGVIAGLIVWVIFHWGYRRPRIQKKLRDSL